MPFAAQHVGLDVRDQVATITLIGHPERKNPLTFESYAELRDLFRALVDVDDVEAVVLTGAGEDFACVGTRVMTP